MAEDTSLPVQSGILDPLIGMGFITPNMSLEEIKRRRAIAGALASRKRDYPKTIGEGMTYFSEAIADTIENRRLAEAEKGYNARRDADFPTIGAPAAVPVAAVEPPPGAVPSVAVPSPAPPAPTGAMANRAPIYQALAERGGVAPPRPMVTANASLGTGAAPAGPMPDGATFAEEGEPNPPTVSRDIKPMLVADATGARPGGLGRIPGPFEPRAKETRTPVETPVGPPAEPQMGPETPREQAMKAYQRRYRDDPIAVQNAQQAIDSLKQAREKDWVIRHEKWKIDYADHLKQNDPKYRQELEQKAKENQRQAEDYTEFPLGGPKEHQAVVKENYETVKNIPKAQAAVGAVKGLLASDAGMFTGSDANIKLSLAKWAQALGAPYNPAVSNTETFRGLIVPILAALRPAIVGPGAQSLPELKMLQDAAAGNITLDRKSIENILGTIEKQGVLDAVNHQRLVAANAGRGPRSEAMRQLWSSSFPLPMEKLVPSGAARQLRDEVAKVRDPAERQKLFDEFDEDYATPGLAQRMLGR